MRNQTVWNTDYNRSDCTDGSKNVRETGGRAYVLRRFLWIQAKKICTGCSWNSEEKVLANMFLHYVFDMWMKRNFPNAPFERYADDGVVHCSTKEEALYIKEKFAKRI